MDGWMDGWMDGCVICGLRVKVILIIAYSNQQRQPRQDSKKALIGIILLVVISSYLGYSNYCGHSSFMVDMVIIVTARI
jgi:hypothetical protein